MNIYGMNFSEVWAPDSASSQGGAQPQGGAMGGIGVHDPVPEGALLRLPLEVVLDVLGGRASRDRPPGGGGGWRGPSSEAGPKQWLGRVSTTQGKGPLQERGGVQKQKN